MAENSINHINDTEALGRRAFYNKQVNIWAPGELYERLKKEAEKLNMSVSRVARHYLEEGLKGIK